MSAFKSHLASVRPRMYDDNAEFSSSVCPRMYSCTTDWVCVHHRLFIFQPFFTLPFHKVPGEHPQPYLSTTMHCVPAQLFPLHCSMSHSNSARLLRSIACLSLFVPVQYFFFTCPFLFTFFVFSTLAVFASSSCLFGSVHISCCILVPT